MLNGKYGAKIGNILIFTKQGALDAYKSFLDTCYPKLSYESFLVLSQVEEDMIKIGFSYEELEQIEFDYLLNA